MPAELIDAISRAQSIIYWQENVVSKDMPPKWMWTLDEELNRHFERIRDKSGSDDHDDDRPAAGPMLVNEYAQERRRNANAR